MTFFYDICQIKIQCDCPFEVYISPETKPFLTDSCPPDVVFRFLPVTALPLPDPPGVRRGLSYFYQGQGQTRVYRCLAGESSPYACVRWDSETPDLLECTYLPQYQKLIASTRSVVDLLGIETLMLSHRALLLHAAFIRSNGRGILFTAPSGTGKSTQASLWEKHMGAEILNGDRAGVRKIGDTWHAFGLPYAGSSNIFRNESAPLRAVVLLRQAKENRIYRISSAEAMRSIYPEVTIHRWEPGFVNQAVDLFLELCSDVPFYLLECLPDEEAVRTLEGKLLLEEKPNSLER